MASWWWRTKPRSIIKTVQWYKEFGKLDGKNWNEKDEDHESKFTKRKVMPIRREYIYNAHREEDTFLSSLNYSQYVTGNYDVKETESNGRNDKISFEFFGFGYVDDRGIIHNTKVGNLILNDTFDAEDFLKQLLKLYFPNKVSTKSDLDENDGIFPMELLLKAINKFGFLNRSEIVFLFGCTKRCQMEKMYKAISLFRERYNALSNKNDTGMVKSICEKTFIDAYGSIDNQIGSYYDYAEAFCRSLVYTGLFNLSGRSYATKVRVNDYSKSKVDLLLNTYEFKTTQFSSIDEYMEWYGNPNATTLPWDNPIERRKLVVDKIEYLNNIPLVENIKDNYNVSIKENIDTQVATLKKKLSTVANNDDTAIKIIEKETVDYITGLNEKKYIEFIAKTTKARNEILDKYEDILGNEDMSALWLEVNTWKSLLAIDGEKKVKRNFNVEEDLTPKSFAPGVGNTPDMELYYENYVVLPEVSLMTGVRQWEHEASSVIDHVLSFIDAYQEKDVLGLFISTSINIRTNWQFFVLNRESWVGKPVPVVPLTIVQYQDIIKFIYNHNIKIGNLVELLVEIHKVAFNSKDFKIWSEKTKEVINNWKMQIA